MNDEFHIEAGIPIPDAMVGRIKSGRKYQWDMLEVGDSVYFDVIYQAWSSASGYSFRKGVKFCQRRDKSGLGGRIWRTE